MNDEKYNEDSVEESGFEHILKIGTKTLLGILSLCGFITVVWVLICIYQFFTIVLGLILQLPTVGTNLTFQ